MVIWKLFFTGIFLLTASVFIKINEKFDNSIFIIGLILIVSPILILLPIKTEMVYSHQFPIYAMEDNTQTTVRRFVSQTDLKYYYVAGYKGGKKVYSVYSENAYIIENDNAFPKIEVYKAKPESQNVVIQFLYTGIGDLFQQEYKIIVPEGSVTTDFNVDLEN